jgi:hypothetical protein
MGFGGREKYLGFCAPWRSARRTAKLRVKSAAYCMSFLGGDQMRDLALAAMIFVACTTSNHAQSLDQQERLNAHDRMHADYQSHYNTKLGKCLMLVKVLDERLTHAFVIDANERREYAWFSAKIRGGVLSCDLMPSLRETRNCNSREEFDAFITSYMEE